MEALWNPSFNSIVLVISPSKVLMEDVEDQLQKIVKYGISGKKLQEELTDWTSLIVDARANSKF